MYRFIINKRYVDLLKIIARNGKHDILKLSRETRLSYGQMSIVIKQFTEEGIVYKERDEGPGVKVDVSITEKGKLIISYFEDIEKVINSGPAQEFGLVPIGSIVAWHKTFDSVSSGTATTDTLNKLVDTGATFQTDGVTTGMVVYNSTDGTYAIVDTIDSETQISLRADAQAGSATVDVFPDGNENYTIYGTTELPDNWVECNGQTLSDAESIYNGAVIPDLNSAAEETHGRFIRGAATTSGITEASQVKAHTHGITIGDGSGSSAQASGWDGVGTAGTQTSDSTGGTEGRPASVTMFWVMRIK